MNHKMDYNMDQKMDHKMDHNMDHKMNHKMDHNMDQQKMDMKKSPGLPPWLANLKPDQQTSSTKISTSTSKSTTSNQPDWLANIFSSSNSQTKSTTTTEEPFKMPDFANPMMKEDIPMVKINGPSITLPSFSLISDQLKLFPSSEEAEQRTASIATDEQFDLNFFPQKENMADAQARFPLLGNQNIDLGSLETTTVPVPLITQSFTPLENREALTQLVSLYEWAPTLKGEKDKTQNTKEEEKEKPIEQHMEMDKDDNKKPGMNDEKEDQPTDSENNKAPMYSGGIPHSALLQPGSSGTNRPASIDKQEKAEMKQNPPFYPPDPKPQEPFPVEYQGKPKQVTAKDTLALLIQQNKDLTRLLNQQLNEQTRLLTTLMKQIKWK